MSGKIKNLPLFPMADSILKINISYLISAVSVLVAPLQEAVPHMCPF